MNEGETISEFIARRRRELDVAEQDLRNKLSAIAAEREKIDAYERIVIRASTPKSEINRAVSKRRKGIKPGTIMDRVMKILHEKPNGLTAMQILQALNSEPGVDILARESLSPQLSRLKQAGYLTYRNSIWKHLPDEDRSNGMIT